MLKSKKRNNINSFGSDYCSFVNISSSKYKCAIWR